jgi:AcrR family transcriptional regulator
MTDTTPSRGETTRQKIIQVAHQLFVQHGYHGASMRQIAQNAGIALGGLYNHFPGKEDLFEAVFLAYHPFNEVIPAIQQATGENVEGILSDAMRRMVSALESRPEFLKLVFIEIVELNGMHANQLFIILFPQLQHIAERIYDQHHSRLRSIPLSIFIRSFIGLFFSYFLTELLFARLAPADFNQNAVDHLLDIYLHGVLKPGLSSTGVS